MKATRPLGAKGLRLGIAALLAVAATGVCRAQAQSAGLPAGAGALPAGVSAVWDLSKATRRTTATRDRFCINGLWLWQPAAGDETVLPAGNWGYFKVPGPWPVEDNYMLINCQTVFPNPAWKDAKLADVTAAWYQREISVPAGWAERRITLSADCLNSYAAIYLDGKKAGELRFPGGEADITAQCKPGATQTLTILVIALPLKTVTFSHSDTFGSKEVQGHVVRRGLCGDVWLASMPQGPRVSCVKVDTSVRKWEITFEAGLDALAPDAQYTLKAVVSAPTLPDRTFTSKPFGAADMKDGRFSFTSEWHAEKLWDTNTPQNMYQVSLSLLGADSKQLDVAIPEQFGFREIWINGRDFYLNGSRIFLSVIPLDNALIGPATSTYAAAKETMLRLKSFGTNFVYGHNYSCEPGSHISYEEILRAADDVGMLVALPMPHFQDYDWDAADADQANGYAQNAEYYARRVAMGHPSVIAYAMSHNATDYLEAMNPDMIGNGGNPRKGFPDWQMRNPLRAMRAQAILEKYDTSRLIYHHSSGDLGEMYTINFYANFAPMEELDDWFEDWSTKGDKPFFLTEYGSPLSWDFTMYRGWFHGGRGFGSTSVPWELCVAQWNAPYFGDAAFQITDQEKKDLEWESAQFRHGYGWKHWSYPVELERIDATKPVEGEYINDNWRAYRTWGISVINCWEYATYWALRQGLGDGLEKLKVDWDSLQQPGFSPDYFNNRFDGSSMVTAFQPADWTPDPAGQALIRNNMPLLAYIGGKPAQAGRPESFISKDHNFIPGEVVNKQLIIINDTRVPMKYDASWSAGLPVPQTGAKEGDVGIGDQARIPLSFTLPANLPPGNYNLSATVKFGDGTSQQDSFQINVMPQPQPPAVGLKIALFDPKGETAKLLDAMKIPCQAVDANADLSGYDVLVVGKEALSVDGAAPNIMRVKDGLRVIVFEQTCDALTKRLGFRAEEWGLRRIFERMPESPLLAGLDTDNLRDWRGDATLTPSRLEHERSPSYMEEEPTVEWCGLPVPRIWRCGCLGNVASVLVEKPACGNFTPILDGGYSLQYSPLMVYREGKGMVLFCQMDVTGRTESDPAAETLVGNIFRYVSDWKATPTDRKAVYAGDQAGKRHLEHSGVVPAAFEAGKLSPDDVLVVGKGGGKALEADSEAVGAFIKAGGRVLALGLGQDEAKTLLPAVEMKDEEHISTFFQPFPGDSPLAGIGPADVYNAAAWKIPLVTGGAEAVGDGVLARAKDGNVVFWQLPPYSLTSAEGAVQSLAVDTAGTPPDGTHSALVVLGTVSEGGIQFEGHISADPAAALKLRSWEPEKVKWTPEVGKSYTFAVMIEGIGGPIKAQLAVERNGNPYDRAVTSPEAEFPEGKWSDLHVTFTCQKAYPQGWSPYIVCSQDGGAFRADMFRFYEGDYVPWDPHSTTAPKNLIVNPSFEAGLNHYWFNYSEQTNLRRSYRRASFVMTRLLANLGVACPTPLLSRFNSPVTDKAEERWTKGLYVDEVEAWDDPYRFFCW